MVCQQREEEDGNRLSVTWVATLARVSRATSPWLSKTEDDT